MKRTSLRGLRAFTLVELLTVIAIIALLAGIVLPIISKTKQRAYFAQDMASLKQLGACAALYSADNDGCLPYNEIGIPGTALPENPSTNRFGFQESLDRYMEPMPGFVKGSIYNYARRTKIWYSRSIKPAAGWTSTIEAIPLAFGGNTDNLNHNNWKGRLTNIPNRARTVFIAETNGVATVRPTNPPETRNDVVTTYRASHPGNMGLYLFCDFHVESLNGDRSYKYFAAHPTEENIWRWW